MKKNILIIAGVVVLIALAGAAGFWGGMAYKTSQANDVQAEFFSQRGQPPDGAQMPGGDAVVGGFRGGGTMGEVKSIEGNVLTVSGKKETTYEDEGCQYYMKECSFGAFSRSIRLPGEIEEDKVDASFKDGVLTLIMPHKEAPKSKRIEIK